MYLIDGKAIAQTICDKIKISIRQYKGRKPCLAMILIGDDPASKIYVRSKTKKCNDLGMLSLDMSFSSNITEEDLLAEISALNENTDVDGILVQLPLPKHINEMNIIQNISPDKDVDGFHPINIGKMLIGDDSAFLSCTPFGIHTLLKYSKIPITGKHVVVLGRSNIVGKPIAAILMQRKEDCNATVTVAHSQTKNIKDLCLQADILIAAIGQAEFITADMVNKQAVVIDVGINRINDTNTKKGYRLVGDVDFKNVASKCAAITPVPGGVGPMTIAMLLSNTFLSYQRHKSIEEVLS